jgi:dipeptidyl aminopeptidase/acylaminoacyl peptidase
VRARSRLALIAVALVAAPACAPRPGSQEWPARPVRLIVPFGAGTGQWSIWLTDVDGGAARQITKEPGDQRAPSWSQDGQWLYFSSALGDSRDIWRLELNR